MVTNLPLPVSTLRRACKRSERVRHIFGSPDTRAVLMDWHSLQARNSWLQLPLMARLVFGTSRQCEATPFAATADRCETSHFTQMVCFSPQPATIVLFVS